MAVTPDDILDDLTGGDDNNNNGNNKNDSSLLNSLNQLNKNVDKLTQSTTVLANATLGIENNVTKIDDISKLLEQLNRSQSQAREERERYNREQSNRRRSKEQGRTSSRRDTYNSHEQSHGDWGDFQEGVMDGLFNSIEQSILRLDARGTAQTAFDAFYDKLEVSAQDFGDFIGRGLQDVYGEQIRHIPGMKAVGNFNDRLAQFDQSFTDALNEQIEFLDSNGKWTAGSRGEQMRSQMEQGDFQGFIQSFGDIAQTALQAAGGLGEFVTSLAAAAIPLLFFGNLMNQLGSIVEAITELFHAWGAAAKRDQQSREKQIKNAQQRLQADVETYVKTPFDILNKAAQEWYDAWDSNLRTIAGTQGYTKSQVQDLMSAYSARLQQEGLGSYVSAADITTNLTKVLQSGLSGDIANEFAYQATKLNAAIPTQDFFNYASTYASIAANAVQNGESETQAIQTANKALSQFASDLLYSSRVLAGGFSTGLQDASTIFNQATKIAQAGRSNNISGISDVLLAIRSEVGAIAPDLASSLTDAVYNLLTGGNSSSIVALRSLAGINASNTEFLQAVTKNPQQVFSALFKNLGNLYNQSPAAYMEKAEGYADLFGISSEAFQRIDFNQLANAISSMNSSSAALGENIKLLKSGQTTTNADILKNQQINQYMVDEGLSLVLDNEAGRAIQQHLWDEQIANQMTEAEYGVNLVGDTATAILKIKEAVNNILNFLNPLSWLHKGANIIRTYQDTSNIQKDIKDILKDNAVGDYSRQMLNALTRNNVRNGNLVRVTQDLHQLMTKNGSQGRFDAYNSFYGSETGLFAIPGLFHRLTNGSYSGNGGVGNGSTAFPNSSYNWSHTVGASQGQLATAYLRAMHNSNLTVASSPEVDDDTELRQQRDRALKAQDSLEALVNSLQSYSGSADGKFKTYAQLVKNRGKHGGEVDGSYTLSNYKQYKSFDDWLADNGGGLNNKNQLNAALDTAGASYTYDDLESLFEQQQNNVGIGYEQSRKQLQDQFEQQGIVFWANDFPRNWQDPALEKYNTMISWEKKINAQQKKWYRYYQKHWIQGRWKTFNEGSGPGGKGNFNRFWKDFQDYFIKHKYYSNTTGYKYSDVSKVQKKAKKSERGDTVNALAKMLTKNVVDLRDPTIQTNALLAQILLKVETLVNQNNKLSKKESSQLANSIQALAIGLTTNS